MSASYLPVSVLDPSQSPKVSWKSANLHHTCIFFSRHEKRRGIKSEPRV